MPGHIGTLQIKGEWKIVQHVTTLTLMVTTGDDRATSKKSAGPNNQGVRALIK